MKTKNKTSAYIIRSAAYAALLSCVIVGFSSGFNLPGNWSGLSWRSGGLMRSATQPKTLTFADRVAYQRAIEEIYWRHRIWPEANGAKPSLDKLMSHTQIEKKVDDYLRNSQALENYWQKPITPEQLQAEMDRMAHHTRQPEVLREIFAALGNDPYIIAECLARPALADRLARSLYAHDERFHSDLKRRAAAELAAHASVSQMKQTSATYSEIEWVKSEESTGATGQLGNRVATALRGVGQNVPQARDYSERQDIPNAIKLDSAEWNENVQKLAAMFSDHPVAAGVSPAQPTRLSPQEPVKGASIARIKTGQITPLQEDADHYYATAVISKGKDRLKVATVAWMKQPFDSWRAKAEMQLPVTMTARISADYKLRAIGSPSIECADDTWTPTADAPEARGRHTAVWTGTEMIVWGGLSNDAFNLVSVNTGGRYDPATDSWTATSTTNAPEARYSHTAIWTGSRMVVWAGSNDNNGLNTGGRYDPAADSWTPTSTTNAPEVRGDFTAVWTGSEMIVWGGASTVFLNTGGRYDPVADSWTATSTTNAPEARAGHTAVWTGSEMIVWGGVGGILGVSGYFLNTGGRYNPITDNWTPTSTTNAPEPRYLHTAVWTGSEMIPWGGYAAFTGELNTGGRYNPATDSWTATSTIDAPPGRDSHTAIWTGSRMIIWGGNASAGGRYDPVVDSWTPASTTNAPAGANYYTVVWTGSEMIVWGGLSGDDALNTGGRYCVGAPAPTPTPTATATFTPTATATATATATFTPTPTPTPIGTPAAPTALPANNVSGNGFTANWTAVNNATGYRLDVSTSSSFKNYVRGYQNLVVGNVTSRSVTGLSAGTTYYYRVRAVNTQGISPNSNVISVTTVPAPPTAQNAANVTNSSFTARWRGATGAMGYRLDVASDPSFSNYVSGYHDLDVGNVTSQSVTGLNANMIYYYRLRAYNDSGTSGNSNVIRVTTRR